MVRPGDTKNAPDTRESASGLAADEICTEADLAAAIGGVLSGDLTLAQLDGWTNADLYEIAQMGFDLLEAGKYNDAEILFKGLLALNSYDPYFHALLGATYQRSRRLDTAIPAYREATRLDPENIVYWTNLGESLMESGVAYTGPDRDALGAKALAEAIDALAKAIALDKTGKHPSAIRARALLGITVSAHPEP